MKRMIQSTMWMVLLAGALTAVAADSTTQKSTPPATQPREVVPTRHGWSFYDPLIQRNIFSKTGGAPVRDTRRDTGLTTPTYRPVSPSNVWVVTGTAIADGERAAFFENAQTGSAVRLKIGQAVAGGTLTAIESLSVTIQYDSGSRTVEVGMQTDGREAPSSMPTPGAVAAAGASTQPSDGTTPAATPAPAGATSAEAALLERMRARRAQER